MIVVFVYCPPSHAVWPNNEVVKFKPWSVTTPILGSVGYCYEAIIYVPHIQPFSCKPSIRQIFCLLPCYLTLPVAPSHGIFHPPGYYPSPSHHTDPASYLHGVICSSERLQSLMPLLRLFPSLANVSSLIIPPPDMPVGLLIPPLLCVWKKLF